jgi:hypothetical protein
MAISDVDTRELKHSMLPPPPFVSTRGSVPPAVQRAMDRREAKFLWDAQAAASPSKRVHLASEEAEEGTPELPEDQLAVLLGFPTF